MAEEIINEDLDPIPEEATEEPDLSNLDSFLKDAIEKDTPIEYTVPLNAEGSSLYCLLKSLINLSNSSCT